MSFAGSFVKFSRPHTIIGTTLSVTGLYAIALSVFPGVPGRLDGLLLALFSCLGANIYIVGLNQILDIDIDRINKPDLPLPSGRFSVTTAWIIVLSSLALSLGLAVTAGRFLLLTVVASLILGTAYSAPPLRLKRFHFWAALCIFTVRGLLVNILLYLHFSDLLGGVVAVPEKVWILTVFMFGLSLVIAWFKDIPDIAGDRQFRIVTLSVKMGPARVFRLGMALLFFSYSGSILWVLSGVEGLNAAMIIVMHIAAAAAAYYYSRQVDISDNAAVMRYYRFVWILFFVEYILFPVACFV